MKKYKRLIACILSFAMLLPLATIPAHAVETPVTTDEAVYVNLDHYGAVTDQRSQRMQPQWEPGI